MSRQTIGSTGIAGQAATRLEWRTGSQSLWRAALAGPGFFLLTNEGTDIVLSQYLRWSPFGATEVCRGAELAPLFFSRR